METIDWQALPAGKELDEYICRMVGWSVTTNPLDNSATLWTPDLEIVNTWGSSEAWPNVVSIAWNNAPRYSRDAEAAFQLFDALPDHLTPRVVRMLSPQDGVMRHTWKACILDGTQHVQTEVEGESPAMVICLCWLQWKNNQK